MLETRGPIGPLGRSCQATRDRVVVVTGEEESGSPVSPISDDCSTARAKGLSR